MGLLRRLFGSGGDQPPPDIDPDPDLLRLLDEHGLGVYDRQLAFAKVVGERDWSLDQDEGFLQLGTDRSLPAQILGTTSRKARTWLWAWENPSISEELTKSAGAAARIGRERGISFLVEPELDLARVVDGHLVALAVAGLLDADAYYRGTHPGGEVFILIAEPSVRLSAPDKEFRAVSVVSQAILGIPQLVSRPGVANYLRSLGLPVVEESNTVRVDGGSAVFQFDDLGRLVNIQGTSRPSLSVT